MHRHHHTDASATPPSPRTPSATPAQAAGPLHDTQQANALRATMVHFATNQLGDAGLAEDAVQEALTAAAQHAESFRGASAYKTWVFGILKYKVADILRAPHRRETPALATAGDEHDPRAHLFNDSGHWQSHAKPKGWGDPSATMENAAFWEVLDACLNNLPEKQARVFMMREFLELSSSEICESAGLSTSNVHVILHRARLTLRNCLQKNWFEEKAAC